MTVSCREKVMPKFWSTERVPPPDRLAYWVDAVCQSLVHVDCEPRRGQAFFAELRIDAGGPLRVVVLAGTATLVTRSPRQIARDPADNFMLAIHRSGHATLSRLSYATKKLKDFRAVSPSQKCSFLQTPPLRD
jgi:hypothetical protein